MEELKMQSSRKQLPQINWVTQAPREAIAPRFERDESSVSMIAANPLHTFGKWIGTLATPVQGTYQISIACDFAFDRGKILTFLTWRDASGKMISRDYLVQNPHALFSITMERPENAQSVDLELCLCSYGAGRARFHHLDIQIGETKPHRIVKVAAAYLPFAGERTLAKNLADILSVIDSAGTAASKPDILCFTETAYDRRTCLPFQDKFIPEDAPVMAVIRERARQYGMYLVFGIHENDNGRFFNTAYLISPLGEILGKYRKTHITLSEYEEGMMAGSEFPVFDTPIGRLGMMICWDQWFPECARMLHKQRPHILFVQTAGDTDCQIRARAAETGAHVVVSGLIGIGSSKIINPYGEIIASNTNTELGYVCADIDIDKRYYQYWLSVGDANGEGKDIYLNERRSDLYS